MYYSLGPIWEAEAYQKVLLYLRCDPG